MKRILALAASLAICISFCGCNYNKNKTEIEAGVTYEDKKPILDIITTNNIATNLVEYITKDRHDIESIFYDDSPHTDFKYTEDTIDNISNKDLFFYLGSDYEPWSDLLISKVDLKKLGYINISRGIKLQSYNNPVNIQGKTYTENPYYYYSLSNLQTILFNIKIAIEEKDPKNRNIYEDNFNASIDEIDSITDDIAKNSTKLKKIAVVSSTDQMDYFFKELGVSVLKVPQENISEQDINKINQVLANNKKDGKVTLWTFANDNEHKVYDEIINSNSIGLIKIQIGEENLIQSLKENLVKIIEASDKTT